MTLIRRVCEHSTFSTGNGGASFKIVRDSYSENDKFPQYKMITEVSHYGLTHSSEAAINDIGVMDEMIAQMQRGRDAMAAESTTVGNSGFARIYREVIDSIPVIPADAPVLEGDTGEDCQQDEASEEKPTKVRSILDRLLRRKTKAQAVPSVDNGIPGGTVF